MGICLFVWKGQLIDKIKVNTISLPLNLMIAANMDGVPSFCNKSNIFIHLIWSSLWEQYIVGASSVFGRVAVFNPDFYIFLEYLFTSQKLLSLINILNKFNILVYSIMIPPTFLISDLTHTQKFTCIGNWCTLQYRGIKISSW